MNIDDFLSKALLENTEVLDVTDYSRGGQVPIPPLENRFSVGESANDNGVGRIMFVQLQDVSLDSHLNQLESLASTRSKLIIILPHSWLVKGNVILELLRVAQSVLQNIIVLEHPESAALITEPEEYLLSGEPSQINRVARLINESHVLDLQVADLALQLNSALPQIQSYQEAQTKLETALVESNQLLVERDRALEELQTEVGTLRSSLSGADQLRLKYVNQIRLQELELRGARNLTAKNLVSFEDLQQQIARGERLHAEAAKQAANLQQQVHALKGARVYQLAHLFSQLRRSPQDIVRLAKPIWRVLRRKDVAFKKVTKASDSPVVEQAALSPSKQLARFLVPSHDQLQTEQPWVAVVGGFWITEQLRDYENVVLLHPNTWVELFDESPPKRLLVDATNLLAGTSWEFTLEGAAYGCPYHLIGLLNAAKSRGVRTVLWLNLGRRQAQMLLPTARLFDEVLVADSLFFNELSELPEFANVALRYVPGMQMFPFPVLEERECSAALFSVDGVEDLQVNLSGNFELNSLYLADIVGIGSAFVSGGLMVYSGDCELSNFMPPEILAAAGRGLLPVAFDGALSGRNNQFSGLLTEVQTEDELESLHQLLQKSPDLFGRWIFALRVEARIRFDLAYRSSDILNHTLVDMNSQEVQPHAILATVQTYRDLNKLQQIVKKSGAVNGVIACLVGPGDLAAKCEELFPGQTTCIVGDEGDADALLEGLDWCVSQEVETVSWLGANTILDDFAILRLQHLLLGSGADVCGYAKPVTIGEATDLPSNIQYGYRWQTELCNNALTLSPRYARQLVSSGNVNFQSVSNAHESGTRTFAGPLLQTVTVEGQ